MRGLVKLNAPDPFIPGSSVSHLDDAYRGGVNALMTASRGRGTAVHTPGPLVLCLFESMGWGVAHNCATVTPWLAPAVRELVPDIIAATAAPTPVAWAAVPDGFSPARAYRCAAESETCWCRGTARYGAAGRFHYGESAGRIDCDNAAFGDPVEGTAKECYCSPLVSWQPRSDAPTLAPTVRPSIILGTTTLESTLTALSTVESSRSPATTLLPAAAVAGTTTAHPVTGVGGDIVRGVAVRAPGQTGTGFVRIGAGCCRTADGGEGTYEQHLWVGTLVGCIDLCQEHAQSTSHRSDCAKFMSTGSPTAPTMPPARA